MIHVHFGMHLRAFFYQEQAINYKAAILVDLRKMVFILVQEEGEREKVNTLKPFISN